MRTEEAVFISSQIGPAFWAVLIVATYKVSSLLVGLGFGCMGYRLFLAGIGTPAVEDPEMQRCLRRYARARDIAGLGRRDDRPRR